MLKPQSYAGVDASPTFIFTKFILSRFVLLYVDTFVKYLGFRISTSPGIPNYKLVIGLFATNFTPAWGFLRSKLVTFGQLVRSNVFTNGVPFKFNVVKYGRDTIYILPYDTTPKDVASKCEH